MSAVNIKQQREVRVCVGGVTKGGQRRVRCLSEKKSKCSRRHRCWSPHSRSIWLERQSWASEVDALASSGPQGHSFPQSIPQLPARKRGDRAAEIETHLKDSSRFSLKLRSCTETGASRGSGARMQTSLVLRSSVTSGPKSVTGKLVKPTQSQLS